MHNSNLTQSGSYAHVVVVGVDGAGSWFQTADTPNFDRIFKDGAVTYRALASNPTISAECWGSMLLGVGPDVHKLTNDIVSNRPYPTDSAFPSLFRRIRTVMPEAPLGSFCDWDPITAGIVIYKGRINEKLQERTPEGYNALTSIINEPQYDRISQYDAELAAFKTTGAISQMESGTEPVTIYDSIEYLDEYVDGGRHVVYGYCRSRRSRYRARRLDRRGEIRHLCRSGQDRAAGND